MASIGGVSSDWRHGTNGATSSLTDFSAKTRSVELSVEAESVESTAFGDAYREYVPSFINGTIEAEYIEDDTISGQLWAILNGRDTVDFQLSPRGTTSGYTKYTGSMFITEIGQPVEVGELIVIPVSWQVTGAISRGTH